ncbi:hypothetical protein N9934_04845 [Desulfosarcina sp.]|nr:hypothetical protein [Desulfosarcina sp.]
MKKHSWKLDTTLDEEILKMIHEVDSLYIMKLADKSDNEIGYEIAFHVSKDPNPKKWVLEKYSANMNLGGNFVLVGYKEIKEKDRKKNEEEITEKMKIILPVRNNKRILPGELTYSNFVKLYGASAECLETNLTKKVEEYNKK